MRDLTKAAGIPLRLSELGVKRDDFALMAANAMKDGAGYTNPKKLTAEDLVGIFEAAY